MLRWLNHDNNDDWIIVGMIEGQIAREMDNWWLNLYKNDDWIIVGMIEGQTAGDG